MIPNLRQKFNADFTEAKYQAFLQSLDARCGIKIPFRNCETPFFLPAQLLQRLTQFGKELIEQLTNNAAYLAAAQKSVPPAYYVPNESPLPRFVQVDFGLDADLEPKLVELQGFPSLYAYQPFLANAYLEAFGLDPALDIFVPPLNTDSYSRLLKRAIVGDHAPENVVLLEIHPEHQKTRCDFILTERLCGIRTVCITQVRKRENRLFYPHKGQMIPIERIYNRVIVDELSRKQIQPPFDFRDELEVEWAGHPNWFFKLSKFSLPFLDHPSVPRARFLSQIETLPQDLENYVLKPLYSFAGLGVRVGPTREEIASVQDPSLALLQERVRFVPTIETPFGMTAAEIRIMYIWLDRLEAVTTLVRMGRGKMMGVDYNRDQQWVGSSVALVQ